MKIQTSGRDVIFSHHCLYKDPFHTFLSPLYNLPPHRSPGCLIALLPSSSPTSPFYVCSYMSPLATLLSLAGFCLSCFHFCLTFPIHLDHQTSWVPYFPTLLVDDDPRCSIPFCFPDHSYQQSPPSLKFFLPTMLTVQLCQLIPKI